MNLFSGSIAGTVTAVARLVCGLLIVKTLAVYVGPAGTALVAQLQSLAIAAASIASAGFGVGIVRYSAEFRVEHQRRNELLSTAFATTGVCTIAVIAILWLLRGELAVNLLGVRQNEFAIATLAVSLFPIAANALLMQILNGHKEILRYTLAMVTGSVAAAATQAYLAPTMGLKGALIAAAIGQAPAFLVTATLTSNTRWFDYRDFLYGIDQRSLRLLGRYSVMALTTAIVMPTSHIAIREILSQIVSRDAAGIWHGMSRISEVYLTVTMQALATYYLPRLAELGRPEDLRHEIARGFRLLIPMTVVSSVIIYLLRYPIISIIFDDRFRPMADLFAFQMVGDVLKTASYLLAMLMLAKSMTRFYIVTEIVFGVLFVAISGLFVKAFGLVGMAYSHAFVYLAYLVTMAFVMRKYLGVGSRGDSGAN